MVDKIHTEPGDLAMPEGWEPETDNDPMFAALIQLARESDRPSTPPPALMEAVRMETRRQLKEEGLLKSSPAAAEVGFRAWVWTILFGGKAGGQMIRLAAVGCVAFVIGNQSVTPTTQVAPTARATSAGQVASNTEQPTGTPRDVAYNGGSISKSMTDLTSRSVPSPADGWTVPSRTDPRMVTVGASQSGEWGASRTDPAAVAYDQLQMLKFSSLVQGDGRIMSFDIQPIEQAVSQLVLQSGVAHDPRAGALQAYSRAEESLEARRYSEAIQEFSRVAESMPGSSIAFLSRYQVARIADEVLRDYPLAIESYSRCLTDFPTLSVSRSERLRIDDRLQVLQAGQNDNWQSLREWEAAREAKSTGEAVAKLLGVVANSPSPQLASDAADRLKEIVSADNGALRSVDHELVLAGLRQRLASSEPGPATARMQYSLAEIVARRASVPGQALAEYQRALELDPDDATAMTIRARISQINRPRAIGGGAK